jgi:hypothetical protein
MSQNTSKTESAAKPVTEVVAKAKRRQYTAEYKLRILRELDGDNEGSALLSAFPQLSEFPTPIGGDTLKLSTVNSASCCLNPLTYTVARAKSGRASFGFLCFNILMTIH